MGDLIVEDGRAGPGTHALVIGIGEYPHLIGGSAPGRVTDGLGQLTSPPVSAREMAGWLLREYHCPDKPLASLSLLIGEPDPTPFVDPGGVPHPVAPADADGVAAAVKAWKKRADTSPANRTIFYFCGHGTSRGPDMALLMRDFGADDANPLQGALDLRQLVNGMRTCAASEQLYFVDACRAGSDLLIGQDGGVFAGQVPVLGGRRSLDLPRCAAVVYYATLAGEMSHARPGAVSLFTEATLRALRGAAGDDRTDEWWVWTSRLHEAVDHFLSEPRFAGEVVGVQIPAVNELPIFPIHRLRALPIVPVYVTCVPEEGNETAEFVCRQAGDERSRRRAAEVDLDRPADRWTLDLAFGDYEFEARVAPDDVRVRAKQVRPTFGTIRLEKAP